MAKEDTRAAFETAHTAHTVARAEAEASGQHPDGVDSAEVVSAARAHLHSVDRDYEDRTAGQEPAARIVAPGLKAEYEAAQAAHEADPDDDDLAREANRLGEEYQAARVAGRTVDAAEHGRPWSGVTVHTPEG